MPNKKKSGPWRPPKAFIPKPKQKKSGPWRPKKEKKPYELPNKRQGIGWFIRTNILEAPKKDNIILLLFVLSLLIFLVSLYVVILKGQQNIKAQLDQYDDTIVNVQSGNIPFSATVDQKTGAIGETKEVIDTKEIITAFYDAFNQKDIKTMYVLTDKRLNETNMYITYFTTNWLTKFLWWLLWWVQVSDVEMTVLPAKSTEVQEMNYKLQYTLKNGEVFTEQWSALLIKRWESYKIGKLMCETTGCSQMPFFNPGKYWIR